MQNTTLHNLRRQLEAASTLSESLYTIFKLDSNVDNEIRLLDPILWIYNQDKLRQNWEIFLKMYGFESDSTKIFNETMDKYVKELYVNHSFLHYFQFMYDFYPPGFGNAILKNVKNGEEVDGAKIYYKLKYGKDITE